jgi:HSP20 family protein
MQVTRWSPFIELDEIQQRLNRLFVERTTKSPAAAADAFADFTPPVDIRETQDEFIVQADLPDVKKEEIKVRLQDGILSIEGERHQEKEEQGTRFYKTEREFGKFVRRFSMPTDLDAAKVHAEFKEGVLNVHLPKAPSAKPTLVDVTVG